MPYPSSPDASQPFPSSDHQQFSTLGILQPYQPGLLGLFKPRIDYSIEPVAHLQLDRARYWGSLTRTEAVILHDELLGRPESSLLLTPYRQMVYYAEISLRSMLIGPDCALGNKVQKNQSPGYLIEAGRLTLFPEDAAAFQPLKTNMRHPTEVIDFFQRLMAGESFIATP